MTIGVRVNPCPFSRWIEQPKGSFSETAWDNSSTLWDLSAQGRTFWDSIVFSEWTDNCYG